MTKKTTHIFVFLFCIVLLSSCAKKSTDKSYNKNNTTCINIKTVFFNNIFNNDTVNENIRSIYNGPDSIKAEEKMFYFAHLNKKISFIKITDSIIYKDFEEKWYIRWYKKIGNVFGKPSIEKQVYNVKCILESIKVNDSFMYVCDTLKKDIIYENLVQFYNSVFEKEKNAVFLIFSDYLIPSYCIGKDTIKSFLIIDSLKKEIGLNQIQNNIRNFYILYNPPATTDSIDTIPCNKGKMSWTKDTICINKSTSIIKLDSTDGIIISWQKRKDNVAWADIKHTANTFSDVPQTVGTWQYRVKIKCSDGSEQFSEICSIEAIKCIKRCTGVISKNKTIFLGESYSIFLKNPDGNIITWQKKLKNEKDWKDIPQSANINPYKFTPVEEGIWQFHAQVNCSNKPPEWSDICEVTVVLPPPCSAGYITPQQDKINLGAPCTLKLKGCTGKVVGWVKQREDDLPVPIKNTDYTHKDTPLQTGKWTYWAIIDCDRPSFDKSKHAIIEVIDDDSCKVVNISLKNQNMKTIEVGEEIEIIISKEDKDRILFWEKKNNNSEWEAIKTKANTFAYTPQYTGKWFFRAAVNSNNKTPEYTNQIDITVLNKDEININIIFDTNKRSLSWESSFSTMKYYEEIYFTISSNFIMMPAIYCSDKSIEDILTELEKSVLKNKRLVFSEYNRSEILKLDKNNKYQEIHYFFCVVKRTTDNKVVKKNGFRFDFDLKGESTCTPVKPISTDPIYKIIP